MKMHLPQELIDHIIGHLYDDKQSLRFCSLVSHSFQPSSRIGLFRKFRVKCSKAGIHRLIEFSNFLCSKPSVAKYIHELELNGEETYCMAVLPRSTLCSILTNLPNLHSLFLVRFVWKYSSQQEVSSKDIFIPLSLRRLNLFNLSIKYSVCDRVHLPILNIFSLFGTIEELAIDRLWIPGAHHAHDIVQQQIEEARQKHENRTLIHKFRVSSFNLNASCPGGIFMMEIIRNTSSPRYLNLHLSTSLNANAARTLIAHSIPSLNSLTLNILRKYTRCRQEARVSEPTDYVFDLSKCKNLKSLRFNFGVKYPVIVEGVKRSLERLSKASNPPPIRDFTLQVTFVEQIVTIHNEDQVLEYVDNIGWKEVYEFLLSKNLARLEKVTVDLSGLQFTRDGSESEGYVAHLEEVARRGSEELDGKILLTINVERQ